MQRERLIKALDGNVELFGIAVSALNGLDTAKKILDFALSGQCKFVTYVNAHCINISFIDEEYRKIIKKADMLYVGGIGVIWASWFLGQPLIERVNILDFFDILLKQLIDKKVSVYLLGGRKDTVKRTESILKQQGLKVLGSRDGFFAVSEEPGVIWEINNLKPDILMIGMGVPKQEKWIDIHRNELNVKLCWGVGAAFDWLSRKRKRAPAWMIKYGLEWLHRLYQQPRRLWKRYLIGNLIFIFLVLQNKMRIHRENN